MRPSPLLTRTLLLRAATTWMLARLFASVALSLARIDPLRLEPAQIALMIAASLALGLVDVRRRHERALLENLAVTRTILVLLFVGPALIGELAIVLLVRAL